MTESSDGIVNVLLVEDSDADALRIQALLRYANHGTYEVFHAKSLGHAIDAMRLLDVHVVLLDMSLPDAHGIDGVKQLASASDALPIVVLTGHDDFKLGIASIRAGAQDYVLKRDYDADAIERAIIHAMERQHAQCQRHTLYKESLKVLGEDVDAVQTAVVNKTLTESIAKVRSLVEKAAPEIMPSVDTILAGVPEPSKERGRRLSSHAGFQRMSSANPFMPSSHTDTPDDPKGVLSSFLGRYSKPAGAGGR